MADPPFQPTEREAQIASRLGVANAVLGFVAIITSNVLHRWWPVAAYGVVLLCTLLAVTIWVGRRRGKGPWRTFLQVIRSPRPE